MATHPIQAAERVHRFDVSGTGTSPTMAISEGLEESGGPSPEIIPDDSNLVSTAIFYSQKQNFGIRL